MRQLPSRIAGVMIGSIVMIVLTVSLSVLWMSRALDAQAREHALLQVENARANLLAPMRVLALEYGKWEGALPFVTAQDMSWLYENIGISATLGEAFQLVTIWGGPYAEDVGWTKDGPDEGRPGVLDVDTRIAVEARLAQVPMNSYDGPQFFAWSHGSLYVLGASRFETLEPAGGVSSRDKDTPRIVLGTLLDEALAAKIGRDYLLKGLRVVRTPPQDGSFLPLPGSDGRPVAYLVWTTPRPGTTMLHKIAPLLGLVVLLTATFVGLGMTVVRRSAKYLVVAEERSATAARTDVLTGLPNRAAFNEIIDAPARAHERAVLFLDVNDFKRVNDAMGHAAGDEVIRCAAMRLQSLTAPGCQLARIAGDEFVFVVTDADARSRVEHLAHQVEQKLFEPISVQGHLIQLRMAMGSAVQIGPSMSGEDLVRQADLAMYVAKRSKAQGSVMFSAMLEQASQDAIRIEEGLRRALPRTDEFHMAYQPIVGPDGALVRAEALARWTSPELGVVPPDRFITVAERAGLMIPLGSKLLDLIYNDLVAHPNLKVSLNVSPLQLVVPDFVSEIIAQLRSRDIDPSRVEIELTESVVVEDSALAASRLHELREAGFSTALDDFGTGYSSIGYLEQLRFDTLKIDRSFVSAIQSCPKRRALVSAMILMAHSLELRVVCEGVESAGELDILRQLGCDLVQGYHFDGPLRLADLASRWLGSGVREAAA